MKKILTFGLVFFFGAVIWAADNASTPPRNNRDGLYPAPGGSVSSPANPAPQNEEIALIKGVFKKMEEATYKEDITAYMEVFSKRVEITSPEGNKLSYDDVRDYLVELFDSYDFIKDQQTKELDIRIKDNMAEVVNTYRMSGIPKGEKEIVVFDEGVLKMTLNKLPSFSPKVPAAYQIISVSYIASDNNDDQTVSAEDKTMLLQRIKENYGVNLEASGGFDQYRALLLQELKAENDANREELEARIAILKKRLQKTFSLLVKKEIQADIQELEKDLGALTTENEINSVVDNEIADLKEIFLRK